MPTRPILFALFALLSVLGADTGEIDPAEYLGALDDGPPHDADLTTCPGSPNGVHVPPGPGIDPANEDGWHVLELHGDPSNPGFICSVSCIYASTQCLVSSSSACDAEVDTPAQFPGGAPGSASSLFVCVAATADSTVPLVETVTITTSNNPDTPIWYVVRGSS